MDVHRARQGLAIYFAIVIIVSAVFEWLLIRAGTLEHSGGLLLALMWTPTLASVVARIALKEGFHDVSFRLGGRVGRQSLLLAWLLPVVVGFIAYGIAWSTGIAQWAPPAEGVLASVASPFVRMAACLGVALTIGQLYSSITAAGEELGWRGYMLTRLVTVLGPWGLPVSGVIWGLWHVPLILSGIYATGPNRWASALLFLVSITAAGVVIGWLRLRSGSVWPAVLAHASWNVIIQGVFDWATPGSQPGGAAAVWIGESGYLVVATLVVAAILVMAWGGVRQPGTATNTGLDGAPV
jgi:membrane protease YdiL (CAAX protease family)